MDPTFGTRLRLHRERQQIALTTIAEQTKIKLSLLEALERDDLSHWPAGIFRRSYIRSYARAIGLDADSTVREFLGIHPESIDEKPAALNEPRHSGSEPEGRWPPMRLRFLIGSAIRALPAFHLDAGQTSGPDVPAALPEVEPVPAASDGASAVQQPRRFDLLALADLCTRLGRAVEVDEVSSVLRDAAIVLDAVGLILWMYDPPGGALTAALAHGYSDEVLAQLPRVASHADNAIAAACRSVEPRVVDGGGSTTGALAVPLSSPAGCVGVLALEFRDGAERHEGVRAFAIILAAQLATLFECPTLAQAVNA